MGRRSKGDGTISQRTNGTWRAALDLGIVNGKRKRVWLSGKTKQEVREKLRAAQAQQQAGTLVAERGTVAAFLERWLCDVVQQRNKPRTYNSYRDMVRLHITPIIGHIQLDRLQPDDVQSMLRALQEKTYTRDKEHKQVRRLSTRTIQYARIVLRRALNQALKWGLVSRNVAALAEPPRGTPRRVHSLDAQQARQLLDAIAGDRYELLYRIALSLGLRRGEVLALQWGNIDLDGGMLHVGYSLQRINGKLVRGSTKTDRARNLPLPDALCSALRDARNGAPDSAYVFVSTHGTPIEPRNLLRLYKQILVKAGLPDTFTLHSLRHSCATLLLAQGVPLRVIMDILGHTTITTTADIYAHVLSDVARDATNTLDKLLSSKGR